MRRFRQSAIFLLAVCGVFTAISNAQTQVLNYPATQGQDDYFISDYGSALVQGPDGYLYGAVHVTNNASAGYPPVTQFFRLEPGGFVYSYLGSLPNEVFIDPPIVGDDGNIYDFNDDYSLNNAGMAVLQTPAWKSLVQNAGINYGISGKSIVTVTLPSTVTPLFTFTDSESPTWITIGSDGNIYGVSETGGTASDGTIFKVTPAGVETTLYNFSETGPSSIMQATDGNFYGIAGTGAGTIFQFLPASSALVYQHTFSNQPPFGGLIEASDGNLYGATKYTNVPGYIFKETLAGKFTELPAAFPNDDYPNSSLVQGSDGNLYLGSSATEGDAGVLELQPSSTPAAPVQISASATTVSVGTPVTLTWSTANLPSGTYQPCFAGGGWSGAKAISGTATVTPEQAGGITYSITCNGNESNSVMVEVTGGSQAATTTALTGSVHNIAIDLPLTLNATVSPSSATGQVNFYLGGKWIGSAALADGTATVSINTTLPLAFNTYQFSATYTGDSNYAQSQSAPLTILDQVTVAVTATYAPGPVGQGQAVNLYAAVTNTQGQNQGAPVPAGAVTFASGSYVIGSATSTTGSWQLIVPAANVPVGTYSVVASYSGDSAHLAAASSPFSVTVKYVPQMKLTVTPNPVPKGAEVTITVQVTGAAKGDPVPTGNVVILGTYNLNLNSSGVASITLSTSGYAAGTYPVQASYGGDSNYIGGASNTVEVTLK